MDVKKININLDRKCVTVVYKDENGTDKYLTIADGPSDKKFTLASNKTFAGKKIYDIIRDTLCSFIR